MKTANQTKSCSWARKWSEYIRTKCGFLRFRFGLVRFTVFLLYWFGFEHPYSKSQNWKMIKEITLYFDIFWYKSTLLFSSFFSLAIINHKRYCLAQTQLYHVRFLTFVFTIFFSLKNNIIKKEQFKSYFFSYLLSFLTYFEHTM